jgi:hypothetical protein
VVPQGGGRGKQLLAIVASIAIMAFAWWAGTALAGSLFGAAAGSWQANMLIAGIALVGNLGLSALVRPKVPRADLGAAGALGISASASQSEPTYYTIGGQRNQAKPYAAMPRLLGSARIAPNLVAEPYVLSIGRDSYLFAVYDFGYGPLDISDIRVGDTPIGYLREVDIRIHHFFEAGDALQLYNGDVQTTSVGATLSRSYQFIQADTNAQGVTLEFVFPGGLFTIDRRSQPASHEVWIDIIWRYVGDTTWNTLDSVPAKWISWDSNASASNSVSVSGGTVRQRFEAWASPIHSFRFDAAGNITQTFEPDEQVWVYGDQSISAWLKPGWFIVFPGSRAVKILEVFNWWPDDTTGRRGTDVNVIRAHFRVYVTSRAAVGIPDGEINVVGIVEPFDGPPGQLQVRAATRQALTVQLWMEGFPGNRTVEFAYRRTSDEATITELVDKVSLSSISSRYYRQPFFPSQGHSILEVRVKANDQLSGPLDTLTAYCTSWHTEPHSVGFGGWQWKPSRNPAAHYLEVLRGTANPRPVPDSLIDFPQFERWADVCSSTSPQGDVYYMCDLFIEGRVTIGELLTDIARCGRAIPTIRDGKYSIIMEDEARVPVQMFTVKNTKSMQFERIWRRQPHALRMRFLSEQSNLQEELTVYDDGYNGWNATEFETVEESPGMTRWWQVWRSGRRMLAEGKLRRENWTISTDIEGLICQRGDLVLVASDSLRAGGEAMRIASVEGEDIWLDESIDSLNGNDTLRVRLSDGAYLLVAVDLSPTRPGAVRVTPGNAQNLKPGMLCVLGVTTNTTIPLIVTRVTPGPDFTATIEAVEEASGIRQAEYTVIPDYAPPTWVPSRRVLVDSPRSFVVTPHYTYENRYPFITLRFTWIAPPRVTFQRYILYEIVAGNWTPIADTTMASYELTLSRLTVPREGVERTFAVLGVTPTGSVSNPVIINILLTRDNEPPGPVASFSANILSETILLMWEPPLNAIDIERYELRFASRDTIVDFLGNNINDWNNMTLLADSIPFHATQFTTSARTGLYAISAVDTSGNYGPPSFTRTYIEDLPNLDVVIVLAAGGGPLDVEEQFTTLSKISDSDTLRVPSLSPSAITLSISKFTDFDFAKPPNALLSGLVSHAKVVDADSLKPPIVSRVAAPGALQVAKIIDVDTLRVHIVQRDSGIGGKILVETADGSLLQESNAQPGYILQEAETSVVPTLQTVFPQKLVDAENMRSPNAANITAGNLVFSKYVDTDTLRVPTALRGPVNVGAPRITNANTVRGPIVTIGTVVPGGYYILTENGLEWIALEDGSGLILQEGSPPQLRQLPPPSLKAQAEARRKNGRRIAPRANPGAVRPVMRPGPFRDVPTLPGPGWIGDFIGTTRLSAELRLQRNTDGTYEQEGWFYSAVEFETVTPLRVRMSSMIDAYGYAAGRTMAGWVPLASAVPLDDTQRGRDWDAEVHVRVLRDPPTLGSAWFTPLANAAPLAGDLANQTQWTRLIVGDWDATIVQWAIRLWSREPNITPSVRWAEVRVDVVERRESGQDVAIDGDGTRILFENGFWEPPVLSLTLANAPEGTKIVRAVDRNGFDVTLISNGVPTSGIIDWFAMGYGKSS